MRQIKPLTVRETKVESLELFTQIKFNTTITGNDKTIWVSSQVLKQYFLDKYAHLGINKVNVDDFLLRKDPKYKVESEDIEKFLIHYLYDNVIIKEETYNT